MKYFFEERSVAITEYISGDLDFGAHLHGVVEIGFAAEGSSRLCIEDRSYEIKAGDMFMVFPNMIHRYEHSEAIKAYVVIFSAALLPEYAGAFREMRPVSPVIHCGDTHIPALFEMFFSNGNMTYETKQGLILAIMGTAVSLTDLERQAGYGPGALKDILMYCERCYTDNITIETAASALHMSRSHISHIMRDKLNTTFCEYINMKRTDMACELLGKTSLSVTDTAFAAGFGSVRSFNRIFLKHTGCTPREYRRGKKCVQI